MTKTRKILSAIVVGILSLVCIFSLTSCKKDNNDVLNAGDGRNVYYYIFHDISGSIEFIEPSQIQSLGDDMIVIHGSRVFSPDELLHFDGNLIYKDFRTSSDIKIGYALLGILYYD